MTEDYINYLTALDSSRGYDSEHVEWEIESRFLMENEGVPFRGAEVLG